MAFWQVVEIGQLNSIQEVSQEELMLTEKTKRPAFVGLGHELAHAFDALDNQIAPDAASLRSR